MPVPVAIGVTVAQSLAWVAVVSATRRLILRWQASWTVLIYPVLWVALDTLLAALLPDGNWGSQAYSQSEFLPFIQLASLLGVPALLFLVTLVPSTIAFAMVYRLRPRGARTAYVTTTMLLLAALGFGFLRLRSAPVGQETVFGLIAIDDPIGLRAEPPYIESILREYDRHIAAVAERGATVVVLPEKMAVVSPENALLWRQHFAAQAAAHRVWLVTSVTVDDGGPPKNLAWLLSPQGALDLTYQKHHLAPPERGYSAGEDYAVREIAGIRYGIGICKDMHFARFGRAYGQRDVAVMLVPAWDFQLDRWLGARMTAVRGVENGYTVVRSSRDGLLTATDAYGRLLAETPSAPLPGTDLVVTVQVPPRVATLYTHVGEILGWLCVVGAAALLWAGRGRR
jgi:apolipoprotein N-acyltransferase